MRSPSNYTDDLRLAHILADSVDGLTMRRFKAQDLHVETKPDLTPVTDADREAESVIRSQLGRVRNRDAVIGEEFGTSGSGSRKWVIDPIDGTKNFVRGVPVWATLIGLVEDDQGVAGVVSAAGFDLTGGNYVLIQSGELGGPVLPEAPAFWIYPATQPLARLLLGIWLLRVARNGEPA